MYEVRAYRCNYQLDTAILSQIPAKKDWIKDNGAYSCFPLALANRLGWGISFPKDISFIYRGNDRAYNPSITEEDPYRSDFEIFSGEEFCYFGRGFDTISFKANLAFITDENVSLLTIPVPNQSVDGVQCLTSVLSTSFFTGDYHVVWRITEKDKLITIPAGTPVAAIIPIDAESINNSTVVISDDWPEGFNHIHGTPEYNSAMVKKSLSTRKASDFFKDAIDHFGNKIGRHQVKSFKFNVKDKRRKND